VRVARAKRVFFPRGERLVAAYFVEVDGAPVKAGSRK
jgi:hypothetical protein